MLKLDRTSAAVDLSSERLVSEVLQSANKHGGAAAMGSAQHTTSSFAVRGTCTRAYSISAYASMQVICVFGLESCLMARHALNQHVNLCEPS